MVAAELDPGLPKFIEMCKQIGMDEPVQHDESSLLAIAAVVDPWLASVGSECTVYQLMDSYQALDKNIARNLTDRELLPVLGLNF